MQKVNKLIATVFYIGYVPYASGTAGSIAGLGCYMLIKDFTALYITVTLVLLIVGVWSASVCEKGFASKDPKQIVIDEFAGMMVTYLLLPYNPKMVIAGFFIFRFFDIFKLPWIKKSERLRGGYGIMMDDFCAALIANTILRILGMAGVI